MWRALLISFALGVVGVLSVSGNAFGQEQTSASPAKDSKTAALGGFLGNGGDTGEHPVYIKSDSLKLDSKDRVFTYQGNVEILRADVKITADAVIGKYSQQNELETVICEDNVVVTRGEDLRATANRAVYDVAKDTIELTEAPELMRQGNVLSADRIIVFVKEDRSEAEGNVRVKVVQPEERESSASIPKTMKDFTKGEKEVEPSDSEE